MNHIDDHPHEVNQALSWSSAHTVFPNISSTIDMQPHPLWYLIHQLTQLQQQALALQASWGITTAFASGKTGTSYQLIDLRSHQSSSPSSTSSTDSASTAQPKSVIRATTASTSQRFRRKTIAFTTATSISLIFKCIYHFTSFMWTSFSNELTTCFFSIHTFYIVRIQ